MTTNTDRTKLSFHQQDKRNKQTSLLQREHVTHWSLSTDLSRDLYDWSAENAMPLTTFSKRLFPTFSCEVEKMKEQGQIQRVEHLQSHRMERQCKSVSPFVTALLLPQDPRRQWLQHFKTKLQILQVPPTTYSFNLGCQLPRVLDITWITYILGDGVSL